MLADGDKHQIRGWLEMGFSGLGEERETNLDAYNKEVDLSK